MDNKISTITIYPTKNLYPNIFIDHRNYKTKENPFKLDFNTILFINCKDINRLIDNLNYTASFIENEYVLLSVSLNVTEESQT